MGGDKAKMEINMKRFLVVITLVAVLMFSMGYSVRNGVFSHRDPQVNVNMYVLKETPEGNDLIYSGNVITDRFENKLGNIFGFNNETVYETKWIALGNSTIDQTKTKLDAEATTLGFARAVADSVVKWSNGGDTAINYTKKFTATGDIQIDATALHESVTGEATDAVALASLGGAEDFKNNWNCTIIWVLTWNAN